MANHEKRLEAIAVLVPDALALIPILAGMQPLELELPEDFRHSIVLVDMGIADLKPLMASMPEGPNGPKYVMGIASDDDQEGRIIIMRMDTGPGQQPDAWLISPNVNSPLSRQTAAGTETVQ